jgi:hypothetical protein
LISIRSRQERAMGMRSPRRCPRVGRWSWARRRASSDRRPAGPRQRTSIALVRAIRFFVDRGRVRPHDTALVLPHVSLSEREAALGSRAARLHSRDAARSSKDAAPKRKDGSSGARRRDSEGERGRPILRRCQSGARRRVPSSWACAPGASRCRSQFERRGAILRACGSEGRRQSAEAQRP